ncbi:hypothetical protein Hte_003878 [Hypoxylon texense]
MMYKLFTGQESELEVLYEPPQASELRHDVYLVHGFYTTKYSNYKTTFEDWAVENAKSAEAPLCIKVFRFNINIISTRREHHALLRLAWALRQSLLGISDDASAPLLLSDEELEYQSDSEIARQNVSQPKCVSFITHGFGAWIVREALASPGNRNLPYVPFRLIFIDAPWTSSNVENSSPDYSTYFRQIQDVFRISSTDIRSKDNLKSHLLKIDRNFKLFLADGSSHECVENLPVWINTEAGSRSTWTDRFLRFVPLYPLHSQSIPLKELRLTDLFSASATYEGSVSSEILPLSLSQLLWNDAQRNPNLRLITHHPSHDETMSDTSNATVPPLDSDLKRDLDTMGQLAYSFLQRGELENAETLYVRMNDTWSGIPNYPALKLLQIRLQIAYIRLYLGRYEETKNNVEIIQQRIKEFSPNTDADKHSKNELEFNCCRCLAGHMLRTGRWEAAITEFERLLIQRGNNQDRSTSFKIIRDLALAYAYIGGCKKGRVLIAQARDRLNSQESPSTSKNHEKGLQIKHLNLDAIESTIDMLSGDYPRALGTASKSLANLEATLGPRHFKTLAVANLKAWCLVHEGRFADSTSKEYNNSLADVELLCLSTFRKLAQSLGHRHYLALDSMECLVRIFICQGRLVEAIDTGTSAYETVTESLSEDHPQAISCKSQLAAAHLAQGNYHTSRTLYKAVYEKAKATLGSNHPKTIKYNCELARAYLYHGEIGEASTMAVNGAAQLLYLYCNGSQSSNSVPTVQSLVKELEGYMVDKLNHRLHPDVTYSLQLLAEIELHKHRIKGLEGNLGIAEQILRVLVRSLPSLRGNTSILKASVCYDLAIVLRERRDTSNGTYEFIGILEEVVQDRKRLFGGDHPDTLQACRELLRSNLARYTKSGEDLENKIDSRGFLSTSKNIWTCLQSRYGLQFPQTLQSRVWRLIIWSVLGRVQIQEIEEEVRSISRILTSPQLVFERLIESISMRNHLADFLIRLGIPHLARQLLESSEENIKKAQKESVNEGLCGALKRLQSVVDELKPSHEKMPPIE